jgi:hypothetical protein
MESDMQANEGNQRFRLIGIVVLAALVLASAVSIVPRAQTSEVVNAAQGLDTTSLTSNAGNLPEQYYPAY